MANRKENRFRDRRLGPRETPGDDEDGGSIRGKYDDDRFAGPEDMQQDDDRQDDEDEEQPIDIGSIPADEIPRVPTGLSFIDTLFEGGLPTPCIIMLAGTPGAGKSRVAIEVAARLAHGKKRGLYICGEEPKAQLAKRFKQMQLKERFPKSVGKNKLIVYATQNLENIVDKIDELAADIVIVDSLFCISSEHKSGAPGDEKQLEHAVLTLMNRAHSREEFRDLPPCSIIGIAHGTKNNLEAGANRVKHWVDASIFVERAHPDGSPREDQRRPVEGEPLLLRMFATGKNRFAPADIVTHFEMTKPNGIPKAFVPKMQTLK